MPGFEFKNTMKIYLLRKEKGRIYKSEDIVRTCFGRELTHDSKGAPLLGNTLPDTLQSGALLQSSAFISISDTSGYWTCVFSDCPVGLDMEESSRPVKPAVARRLHKEEQEYLEPLAGVLSEWKEEFLSIWTKKEAVVKLCGKGLSAGFSDFSVFSRNSVDNLVKANLCHRPSGVAAGSVSFAFPEDINVKLAGFTARGLMFGVASLEEGELNPYAVSLNYDAPMERPALESAADMLDVRGYASSKLAEKLMDKGYSAEETAQAVEKLQDYGYLNDAALAESMAEKLAKKGCSASRIEIELKNKGISKDVAAAEADKYRETDRERAEAVYNSMKSKSRISNARTAAADADSADAEISEETLNAEAEKEKARIARKLSSLGYGASIIYGLLD